MAATSNLYHYDEDIVKVPAYCTTTEAGLVLDGNRPSRRNHGEWGLRSTYLVFLEGRGVCRWNCAAIQLLALLRMARFIAPALGSRAQYRMMCRHQNRFGFILACPNGVRTKTDDL